MRVEHTFVTRPFELDRHLRISPAMLLRYMEHLRWRAVTDPRYPTAALFAKGNRMVVRSQRLEVVEQVTEQEAELRGRMWVQEVGRSSVHFAQEVLRGDDVVARAVVTGVYLGRGTGPTRVPDLLRDIVIPERLEPGPGVPRDLEPPADAWSTGLRVRASDMDLFQHVNHATYVDWVEDARALAARGGVYGEAVGDRTPTRRLAIDYVREALLDQVVAVSTWTQPHGTLAFEGCRDGEDRPVFRAMVTPG
ncbi:MAG: thioesterase family protein [Myxococcota bacterium]